MCKPECRVRRGAPPTCLAAEKRCVFAALDRTLRPAFSVASVVKFFAGDLSIKSRSLRQLGDFDVFEFDFHRRTGMQLQRDDAFVRPLSLVSV